MPPSNDPPQPQGLPPLAAEDHVCEVCPLSFPALSVEEALKLARRLPADLAGALAGASQQALRTRPAPEVWSPTEYVFHLRDVFISFTIRFYRVRTEDRPALEPVFNDLRAARFDYNRLDARAILPEIGVCVDGFCAEIDRVRADGWDRVATRLPDEPRTARWLVRQAAHEGLHHLGDIRSGLLS